MDKLEQLAFLHTCIKAIQETLAWAGAIGMVIPEDTMKAYNELLMKMIELGMEK